MPMPPRGGEKRIARRKFARPIRIRPRNRLPRLRRSKRPLQRGKPARIQHQKNVPAPRNRRNALRIRNGTRRKHSVAAPQSRILGIAVRSRKYREKILRSFAAVKTPAKTPQRPTAGTRKPRQHRRNRRRKSAATGIRRKRIREADCPKLRHRRKVRRFARKTQRRNTPPAFPREREKAPFFLGRRW